MRGFTTAPGPCSAGLLPYEYSKRRKCSKLYNGKYHDRIEGVSSPSEHLQLNQFLAAATAAVVLSTSLPCDADTVRVQDVQSPTLRAGLEAANEGRLAAAERFFQTYLAQEDASSASAYSNLGNVHLQQGRTKQAIEDFSKAVELAPTASVPYLNRAIAYEQLGLEAASTADRSALWDKAIADCDAAIEADPREFAAWFDRGNIQMRRKDYPGALDSFATAADLAPGLAGYRLREATLRWQTGDVIRAKQQVKGIVRKYGNYAEAHAVLAAFWWEDGTRAAAEEQLALALDADPGWGNIASVRENTRWPPALYELYAKLLAIEL